LVFSKSKEVKEIGQRLSAKDGGKATPSKTLNYGTEKRQWLNLYLAQDQSKPTALYIWAHANEGTASGFPLRTWQDMSKVGISAISWESVSNVKDMDDYHTCEADCKLVFDWVLAHAKEYNFDTNKIVIGGTSRGSIITWKFSQENWKQIRGIYSMNAFPDEVWGKKNESPFNCITSNSPPFLMAFRSYPNIPDDIEGHDAIHGIEIAEKYKEHGIGDRATVVHSIGYANPSHYENEWSGLVKFMQQVTSQTITTSSR
jgi:hypothetical protein